MTYYISGAYENEKGVFRLPQFEEDSIRATRGEVPDNQIRPNALEKYSVRGNVHANVSPSFDVDASLGFVTNNTRLVENDNSFLTVNGSGTASGVLPEDNRGWFFIPAELFAELAQQEANRFTGGFTGNWRPLKWLTSRATIGYDIVNRTDVQFFPTGEVADFGANRAGVRSQNRFDISQTSVDLAASRQVPAHPEPSAPARRSAASGSATSRAATSRPVVGSPPARARSAARARSKPRYPGRVPLHWHLHRGGDRPQAAPVPHRRPPLRRQQRLRQELQRHGLPEGQRLLADVGRAVLQHRLAQHAAASRGLRRLGAAAGHHRRARFYRAVSGKKDEAGTTGVTFGSLGNPDLKPERSDEFEIGFDAGMFKDRLSLELTYYDKLTKDALIERPVAPSLGASRTQFVNLSRIKNHGFELAITTRIIDSKNTAWDLTRERLDDDNKIEDLGAGVSPIFVGFYQQHRTGYPAGGFWAPTIHYNDANGDGIIEHLTPR